MSVQSASVTVATAATALNAAESAGSNPVTVLVKVPAAGVTVYLGGADVTTGNGFPVAAGESVSFDLQGAEILYGCVASSTQAVNVLRGGVG